MSESENIRNIYSLESFVEENYSLIAVMGIFGAISIYLNRISDNVSEGKIILNAGIFSSLFLFCLVAVLINKQLFAEVRQMVDKPSDLFNLIELEGVLITLFVIPFNILIVSIIITSLNYDDIAPVLGGVLLFIISIAFGAEIQAKITASMIDKALPAEIWTFVLWPLPSLISSLLSSAIFLQLIELGFEMNWFVLISNGRNFSYVVAISYGILSSQIYMLLLISGVLFYEYRYGDILDTET